MSEERAVEVAAGTAETFGLAGLTRADLPVPDLPVPDSPGADLPGLTLADLTAADLAGLEGTVLGACLRRVLEEADAPPDAVARFDSKI